MSYVSLTLMTYVFMINLQYLVNCTEKQIILHCLNFYVSEISQEGEKDNPFLCENIG